MEFVIVMLSVPLFLVFVLLLSLIVLSKYPKHETTKGSSSTGTQNGRKPARGFLSAENSASHNGVDNVSPQS